MNSLLNACFPIVILSGGYSARFGQDKLLFFYEKILRKFENKTEQEIFFVRRQDQNNHKLVEQKSNIIFDNSSLPDGPMRGVYSSLEFLQKKTPSIILLACDIPYFPLDNVNAMSQETCIHHKITYLKDNKQKVIPFPSVWPTNQILLNEVLLAAKKSWGITQFINVYSHLSMEVNNSSYLKVENLFRDFDTHEEWRLFNDQKK